ncbi:MAG: phosphatidylserine/phosphatidylglycerophosphate/cardiolipin synthase family protein [Verrucomicrobiota bacterium]|nr:phosphatidylserine/phosphatidylglycerophosphate/cardiolipin synthase family protein [Verrucomicrobiota bacterium]
MIFSKREHYQIKHQYSTSDPQFERTMNNLLGPGLLPGNEVATLRNGDQIFPTMLRAIRSAKRSIDFETYVYWKGSVGRQFAEALAERARAGVAVHVILDWQGTRKLDHESIQLMKDAGVEIAEYNPLQLYNPSFWYSPTRINNRTHRKLLIVDGKYGFTGGVGIADEWDGHAQDPKHWRDNHYKVEGPVVSELQSAFLDNWLRTNGSVLHGNDYFPPLSSVGPYKAQTFKSSSKGGSESARLMYLMSISSAAKSVRLANAYFVPDKLAIDTFLETAHRGVKIEIIVPGRHIDQQAVRRASHSKWRKLLEAGIRIFEYQPTMFHCKYMIVDGIWVSVGSSNFDARSFRLNAEANLNVLDARFAAEQIKVFEQDKARSKEITLEMIKHQPIWDKVLNKAVRPLEPEL